MARSALIFQMVAGVFGLYGVALGAVASHAVADATAAGRLGLAAIYALLHAGVLAGWREEGRVALVVRSLFAVGVILFCGALTLRHGFDLPFYGKFAPIGGSLLMAAWLGVAVVAARALMRRS